MAMNFFQTVGAEQEVRDYLNRMSEELNYVFTHLDERNFPGLRGIISEAVSPTAQNVLVLSGQVTALSQQIAAVQAAADAAQQSANAAGTNASAALTQVQTAIQQIATVQGTADAAYQTAVSAASQASVLQGTANDSIALTNNRTNALRQICLYLASFHGVDAQNAVSQGLTW